MLKNDIDPRPKVNSLEAYAKALGSSDSDLALALGRGNTQDDLPIDMSRKKRRWNGSKWIRKARRYAIYARDGWRCIWCRCRVGIGAKARTKHLALAHLDHIKPRALGGSNATENLVTSCKRCNDKRGTTPAVVFAKRMGALTRLLEAIGKVLPS